MAKQGEVPEDRNPKGFAEDVSEPFLDARHIEIAAKLEAARTSVAQGKARELEPLTDILRDARQAASR